VTKLVMRQSVEAESGWPIGKAEVYLDLNADGLNPDGAVVDADGNIWIAQWGAARVAAYDPDGNFLKAVAVGGQHSSCPAFGGDDLTTLLVTTAREGIDEKTLAEVPENGMVFSIDNVAQGVAEPRVIL
ncbi:SMP-30/gluconolactonase/LRE family protein, partial [Synechococcus sp. MU1644]|nr:SMP-30/gluconolactonase/LRE family protein [Synechococcus sp. MU1644]